MSRSKAIKSGRPKTLLKFSIGDVGVAKGRKLAAEMLALGGGKGLLHGYLAKDVLPSLGMMVAVAC